MAAVNKRLLLTSKSLDKVFKMFDQDNNGYLELDDFQIMFGNNFSDEKLLKIIKEADENHDSKISFEEFKKIMNQLI